MGSSPRNDTCCVVRGRPRFPYRRKPPVNRKLTLQVLRLFCSVDTRCSRLPTWRLG
jgi:hypothetical protein